MGYWLLPAKTSRSRILPEYRAGRRTKSSLSQRVGGYRIRGELKLGWSVASSVLFSVVMLGLSAYEFEDADY
jgi:hypothetical protein